MDTIFKRRSIRKYTDEKIGFDVVESLIKAGMAAPSAGDQRPWEFIIVDNEEDFRQIIQVHPNAFPLKNAGIGIVVCGDESHCKFPAYWVQDCAAATENILLEATAQGLGTCWLGIYPRPERIAIVKELYNLPDSVTPLCIVAVGQSDEEKEDKDLFDKDRIHVNGW